MQKRTKRQIIKVIITIIGIPIIYQSATMSFPYLKPVFQKVAIVSAGLRFLEGGEAIISKTSSQDDDYILFNDIMPFEFEDDTLETHTPPQIEPPIPPPQIDTPVDESVKPANAGVVLNKTYSQGNTGVYISLGNGFIKNCTKIDAQKINKTVSQKPKFKIKADGSPEVLIMHTHATESYQSDKKDWFSKSFATRTTDNTKNVTRVGDEIEKQLKNSGIGVMHDKTLHDYPSYNGSYEKSAETVKRILKENPSIKVVLDIHRDAIQPDANTMVAPVTKINGKSCAQVMIISGCDNGKFNMPNYMENLKFSASLQRSMEKNYPTLTRPILFDYRKYNQDLTTGSILIEVGGHANTLDEAIYAGELVGDSLVKTLLELK